MMKIGSLVRVAYLAVGAVLAASQSELALAQDVPKTVSPIAVVSDVNGVNFTSGKMSSPALTLSVPGSPHLRFDLLQNAAPYVKGNRQVLTDSGDDVTAQYTVHTADGMSEAFTCVWALEYGADGKACKSVTGTGSMLNYGGNDYRKAGSGERYALDVLYMYTQANQNGNPDQSGHSIFYASRVDYPDGEVISYTYDSASITTGVYPINVKRPIRIASNLGYFIEISYQGTDPTQGDWYSPAQAAIYSETAPTTPIQQFTYGSGGTTDMTGRFYAGYGPGGLGSPIEQSSLSQTLPTEGAPSLIVAQAGSNPLVGQVNRDGVAWNYSYTNVVLGTGADSGIWFFDSVTRAGPNGDSASVEIQRLTLVGSQTHQSQIKKVTDALGRSTSYDRDLYLRVTKVTYPEGNNATISYDDAGNVTNRTINAKVGSGLAAISEQAFVDLTPYYNGAGILNCRYTVLCYRMQWYKDAKGNQTDFAYNTRGQLTEMTDPADLNGVRRKTINDYEEINTGKTHMEGQTVVQEYISRKVATHTCRVSVTCGTSDDTRVEYQYWGATFLPTLERRIDPATGETRDTTFTYDTAGRVLSVDGPLPGTDDTQYFRYDVVGRKTWEIGPLAPNGLRIAKRTTYRDADDKPVIVETGTITSSTDTNLTVFDRVDLTYDSRRYAIRETRTASGSVQTVTDRSFLDSGLAECTTVRMNLAALPAASATGACSAGTAGSNGPDRIVKNIYDPAGQLVQVREGVGSTIEAAETTYSYTANGKKQYVIDGNGNRAQFIYDGHDRLSQWIFPSTTRPGAFNDSTPSLALSSAGSVNTADNEQYGYDANGNRTSLRKRDGSTLTYSYDALNRMTVKVVPERANLAASQTRDVYYDYDFRGLMTSARFDSLSGEGVSSTYNGFGELLSSTSTMSGITRTLGYAYDKAGKRVSLTHADGQVFTYARDSLGRPVNIYEGTTASSATQIAQASFDNRGLLSSYQRSSSPNGFATGFTWDPIGRLTSLANDAAGTANDLTIGQGFSPASQIISQSRSNDAYAWTGAVTVNRNYTTNGLNQYTAAGPASFGYDANGNLTSDGSTTFLYDIENRLVSASGAKTAGLTYDPMGRLWKVMGSTTDTRFLYDGDELIAEYDAAGAMARRYVHSDNADDPVVQYDGASVGAAYRSFLMPDERGSIVGLIYDNGTSRAINSYDEYGIPGSANQGRFQYTGQAWLPELGMYHYKARIYSPTLGRFLQTDPIGYDDQVNLYAYVGDDPVNHSDPTGRAGGPNGWLPEHFLEMAAEEAPAAARNVASRGVLGFAGVVGTVFIATPAGLPPNPEAQRRIDFYSNRVSSRANRVFNAAHYDAASREARGEAVATRADGKAFDHINEIREAAQGLREDIVQLKSQFGHRLSENQVVDLSNTISKASKLLDRVDRFLSKIDKVCQTGSRICR